MTLRKKYIEISTVFTLMSLDKVLDFRLTEFLVSHGSAATVSILMGVPIVSCTGVLSSGESAGVSSSFLDVSSALASSAAFLGLRFGLSLKAIDFPSYASGTWSKKDCLTRTLVGWGCGAKKS